MAAVHAIARSAEMARLLSRELSTVPTVVWRYPGDLDRWVEWLSRTRCPAICIDLALRVDREALWVIDGVARLADKLHAGAEELPRLIAKGPSTPGRIVAAMEAWPGQLTVVSQDPWRQAYGGKRLSLPDWTYLPDEEQSVPQLLRSNLDAFEDGVTALYSTHGRAGVLAAG